MEVTPVLCDCVAARGLLSMREPLGVQPRLRTARQWRTSVAILPAWLLVPGRSGFQILLARLRSTVARIMLLMIVAVAGSLPGG